MWIALVTGWILGSISMYAYIYITAKEAPDGTCVDCRQPDCTGCPYLESPASKLAA